MCREVPNDHSSVVVGSFECQGNQASGRQPRLCSSGVAVVGCPNPQKAGIPQIIFDGCGMRALDEAVEAFYVFGGPCGWTEAGV